jgi:DtxR family transcriptional regulator, Mn-dependent transcriptional regulator
MKNLSPSLEDYLEEIYRLSISAGTIRVTDIAMKLNVSLPSVNKAIRKLKEQVYVTHERYGEITVTDQGIQLGRYLVERNRLLQEFLVLIEADCDVDKEAEAMEHYLSDTTIKAIEDLIVFLRKYQQCYKEFLKETHTKV